MANGDVKMIMRFILGITSSVIIVLAGLAYNQIMNGQAELKRDIMFDIGEIKTDVKEVRGLVQGLITTNVKQDGKIEANNKSIERLENGGN